jgi:HAMP domain-containing protein
MTATALPQEGEDRIRFGIRSRFILIFSVFFTLVLLAAALPLSIFLNRAARDAQFALLDKSITQAVNLLSAQLHGESVLAAAESGDPDGQEIQDLKAQIKDIVAYVPDVDFVWVAVKGPDYPGSMLIVADVFVGEPGEEAESYEFLEAYLLLEDDIDILGSFEGTPGIYDGYFIGENEGDIWTSGSGPVYDSAGNVVAIVGVDVGASEVIETSNTIWRTMGIVGAVALPLLLGIVVAFSAALSRPILDITTVAQALERGDEPDVTILKEEIRRSDELGLLARVFTRMAAEVQAREQALIQTVERLRIEIDQSKKDQEVEAITQSESFKAIKEAARRVREEAEDETLHPPSEKDESRPED